MFFVTQYWLHISVSVHLQVAMFMRVFFVKKRMYINTISSFIVLIIKQQLNSTHTKY